MHEYLESPALVFCGVLSVIDSIHSTQFNPNQNLNRLSPLPRMGIGSSCKILRDIFYYKPFVNLPNLPSFNLSTKLKMAI